MTLLRLSPLALSRSRFALSPFAETLSSIMELSRPTADPWWLAWHARQQDSFRRELAENPFAHGLVQLLTSTKWLPDFVVRPPTGGMRTEFADEAAALPGLSDEELRTSLLTSIEHSWRPHDLGWLSESGLGRRAAAFFSLAWTAWVEPDWPRRRALLERDVMYRAGLLAAYGWPRALEQMTRASAWVGADAIRFSDRPGPDRTVSADGMLFVPLSSGRGTWLCEAAPDQFALVYPARGAAARAAIPADSALDRLIGGGRARILRELARPATSTELAASLQQSLGTIGGHLRVLREAGLVVGARVDRRVVYRLTDLAESLLVDGARPLQSG